MLGLEVAPLVVCRRLQPEVYHINELDKEQRAAILIPSLYD